MKATFHGEPTRTRDGKMVFSLATKDDIGPVWDDLHDAEVEVTIKKYREKRSLDANAYAWVLIDKLAACPTIGRTKTEIYKDHIRDVGGNTDIVCVQDRAVKKLRDSWAMNGLGWFTETMPSKIEGCTNVVLYYGSSMFDSHQMSRLIDNLVQDCKSVQIETLPQYKLEALKEQWK